METTSVERQEYWPLPIQAARETSILRDIEGHALANGKTA